MLETDVRLSEGIIKGAGSLPIHQELPHLRLTVGDGPDPMQLLHAMFSGQPVKIEMKELYLKVGDNILKKTNPETMYEEFRWENDPSILKNAVVYAEKVSENTAYLVVDLPDETLL